MILDEIAACTRLRMEEKKQRVPVAEVKARAESLDANTGFPFERALKQDGISFICEVKKASPSKGVIAEEFPYKEIAADYARAGAAAIIEEKDLTGPALIAKVRSLIEQLKAEGTTMLGIFHDLEFMEGLCDHEFNMQEGMMA